MFKCFVTKRMSKPGDKPFKVVIEKRNRVYTKRVKDDNGNVSEVLVARGNEIVKEVLMSKEGYDIWMSKNPNGPAIVDK